MEVNTKSTHVRKREKQPFRTEKKAQTAMVYNQMIEREQVYNRKKPWWESRGIKKLSKQDNNQWDESLPRHRDVVCRLYNLQTQKKEASQNRQDPIRQIQTGKHAAHIQPEKLWNGRPPYWDRSGFDEK